MELVFKNCNSIAEAKIRIEENKLNIKFGINGVGKSTIAKALLLNANEPSDLTSLTPFRYRQTPQQTQNAPTVEGANGIKSVLIFDESYIEQFVFREDELVKNSFEIFIRTQKFNEQMASIEATIIEIKKTFEADESLSEVITDLSELERCIGKTTKKGELSAASPFGRALGKGNQTEKIPEKLKKYSSYLTNGNLVGWLDWQIDGHEFLDTSDACPYCVASTSGKKELIRSVGEEFDKNVIKHLNSIKKVLERLNEYFSEASNKELVALLKNTDGFSAKENLFLETLRSQVAFLWRHLSNLKEINSLSLMDDDEKVIEKISDLSIKMDVIQKLDSEKTRTIVEKVNTSLRLVMEKAEKLQQELAAQKKTVEETINKHKDGINGFLRCAGYQYTVDIESDPETKSFKMKLSHKDLDEYLPHGDAHLSYGEKNAFAIVLFMYECLSKKPDLIILDDPISSFDKNKKYALLETLFGEATELRGKTVMMLTHDLEPIIDMIYTKGKTYGHETTASFLKAENGTIFEIPIKREDIVSFTKVCDDVLGSQEDNIIKLIHLRRWAEIQNDKGPVYNLISSLLKKRPLPTLRDEKTEMSAEDVKSATIEIQKRISNFSYGEILKRIKNDSEMKQLFETCTNQAKLSRYFELSRLFHLKVDCRSKKLKAGIFLKFIDETFHIENDYIMQLSP